jgi:hypothetical protein
MKQISILALASSVAGCVDVSAASNQSGRTLPFIPGADITFLLEDEAGVCTRPVFAEGTMDAGHKGLNWPSGFQPAKVNQSNQSKQKAAAGRRLGDRFNSILKIGAKVCRCIWN